MTLGNVMIGIAIVLGIFAYLPYMLIKLPHKMDGTSSLKFKPLASKYRSMIENGYERGSSLVVIENGEKVFDFVGGYADTRFEVPWTATTLAAVFGSAILPSSFAFALLLDRNLINDSISLNAYADHFPSKYLTLSDLVQHKTGFVYLSDRISIFTIRDEPELGAKAIFKSLPIIPSGTSVYHFHTLEIIANEIIKKIDVKRRQLHRFFLEEIVWPQGIDLHIGCSPTQLYRVARTYHGTFMSALYGAFRFDFSPLMRSLMSPFSSDSDIRKRAIDMFSDFKVYRNCHPDFAEVPLSSVNTFTNARALAKLLYFLVPKSKSIFSQTALDWMLTPDGKLHYDPVLERDVQYTKSGLFLERSPEGNPIIGIRDDIIGQIAFVDPIRNLSFAYVTNHAHRSSVKRDWILRTVINAIYACL